MSGIEKGIIYESSGLFELTIRRPGAVVAVTVGYMWDNLHPFMLLYHNHFHSVFDQSELSFAVMAVLVDTGLLKHSY